jgi:hypothetical protein
LPAFEVALSASHSKSPNVTVGTLLNRSTGTPAVVAVTRLENPLAVEVLTGSFAFQFPEWRAAADDLVYPWGPPSGGAQTQSAPPLPRNWSASSAKSTLKLVRLP